MRRIITEIHPSSMWVKTHSEDQYIGCEIIDLLDSRIAKEDAAFGIGGYYYGDLIIKNKKGYSEEISIHGFKFTDITEPDNLKEDLNEVNKLVKEIEDNERPGITGAFQRAYRRIRNK